jgi:anti-anti-sigma factor
VSAYDLERLESDRSGVIQLSLGGELDLTNARELEERLRGEAEPDAMVVLDLNRVVFIDSAALHVLFKLASRQGPRGLGVVVDPSASIARTLEIVGLEKVAKVGGSLDEVCASSPGA